MCRKGTVSHLPLSPTLSSCVTKFSTPLQIRIFFVNFLYLTSTLLLSNISHSHHNHTDEKWTKAIGLLWQELWPYKLIIFFNSIFQSLEIQTMCSLLQMLGDRVRQSSLYHLYFQRESDMFTLSTHSWSFAWLVRARGMLGDSELVYTQFLCAVTGIHPTLFASTPCLTLSNFRKRHSTNRLDETC